MAQTLDQKRAALAWTYASDSRKNLESKDADKYRNLAKGAPALIMNSGLMPTLAFYSGKAKEKGASAPEGLLLKDLMHGLSLRLNPAMARFDFVGFMGELQKLDSGTYLRYTDEALELLKWIRQFVDAVPQRGNGHE